VRRTCLGGIAALVLAAASLGGCSSKQLYAIGQEWQRNECRRIDDLEERRRCEQAAGSSYESYRAQTDIAKKP
jgi:hypothetical protein